MTAAELAQALRDAGEADTWHDMNACLSSLVLQRSETAALANLRALAASWGYVVLDDVPKDAWWNDTEILHAPFAAAIGYHPGLHYVSASDEETRGPELVCGLIHELGHLICGEDPQRPGNGSEEQWFGWEIAVARACGLPDDEFRTGNHDYMVLEPDFNEPIEVGALTDVQWELVSNRHLEQAWTRGLVRGGRPLCTRTGRWL